jgi:hypothetical protein
MPKMCFSYEADAPRKMPAGPCFRYEADPPRKMPLPCFSYPIMCFGYPADAPLGNRDAAQPAVPGPRNMPFACFRY